MTQFIVLLIATVLGAGLGCIFGHNRGWNACEELRVKPTLAALENLNDAVTEAFSNAELE